jgi:hypothetical protein
MTIEQASFFLYCRDLHLEAKIPTDKRRPKEMNHRTTAINFHEDNEAEKPMGKR